MDISEIAQAPFRIRNGQNKCPLKGLKFTKYSGGRGGGSKEFEQCLEKTARLANTAFFFYPNTHVVLLSTNIMATTLHDHS